MNKNEECLLKFLENQGRLDKTLDELERFIFSANDNIINEEFTFCETANRIKNESA